MSLDALKPAPSMETVRFESEPPGAEAKTSNGQTCRTPCALALPVNAGTTVTFVLNGYLPATENIDPVTAGSGMPELRPNPVQVELTPSAAPPPKPVKPVKPEKKPVAKKPAAKPAAKKPAPKKPAAATSSGPAPMQPAPAQQQQQAPWPSAPQPAR